MRKHIDILNHLAKHAKRVDVHMDAEDRKNLSYHIANALELIPAHEVPSHFRKNAINAAKNATIMFYDPDVSSKLMCIVAGYCEIMVIQLGLEGL